MSKTLEKPAKRKLGPQNVLYYTSCSFLRSSKSVENCNFWLKSYPKITFYIGREYCIIGIYIFTMEICHVMSNMRSRDDQRLTYAKNYEHPFRSTHSSPGLYRLHISL